MQSSQPPTVDDRQELKPVRPDLQFSDFLQENAGLTGIQIYEKKGVKILLGKLQFNTQEQATFFKYDILQNLRQYFFKITVKGNNIYLSFTLESAKQFFGFDDSVYIHTDSVMDYINNDAFRGVNTSKFERFLEKKYKLYTNSIYLKFAEISQGFRRAFYSMFS